MKTAARRPDLRGMSEPLRQRVWETERRLAACLDSGGHQPSGALTQPRLAPHIPGQKRTTHVRMMICRKCEIPYRVGEAEVNTDDD